MPDDPFDLFATWMVEADAAELNDPNAMTLATVAASGKPSVRIVLLKGWDRDGFVFYTNTESRKGDEIAVNPAVALLFHWKSLRRQIRIEGPAAPVSPREADAYYATRPRISRLGAWASDQSRPLASRDILERRVAALDADYPGDEIPRPPHWSGYRVTPARFEFWQDMPFRLHDRTVFTQDGPDWRRMRLFPRLPEPGRLGPRSTGWRVVLSQIASAAVGDALRPGGARPWRAACPGVEGPSGGGHRAGRCRQHGAPGR